MKKKDWEEIKRYYKKKYNGMLIKTIFGLLFLIISLILMFV